MEYVSFGGLMVSRLILGSNPFSGFSHQGPDRDLEMMRYYTTDRIKRTLFEAEQAGINALVARTDHHVIRTLMEYRAEGGALQWLAQTCPEVGSMEMCIERAVQHGAKGCHLHGGVADYWYAQGRIAEFGPLVKMIRAAGLKAGVAAHKPEVIRWIEDNLEVDYYLCSYYNPAPRDMNPLHLSKVQEKYTEADRQAMTAIIGGLSKPVVHYKIMGAGRNDPREAFRLAASKMRPGDAVCVGMYTGDKPGMIAENARLLEEALPAPR